MALLFGANDMGSLMIEENVVAAAGTSFRTSERKFARRSSRPAMLAAEETCSMPFHNPWYN